MINVSTNPSLITILYQNQIDNPQLFLPFILNPLAFLQHIFIIIVRKKWKNVTTKAPTHFHFAFSKPKATGSEYKKVKRCVVRINLSPLLTSHR